LVFDADAADTLLAGPAPPSPPADLGRQQSSESADACHRTAAVAGPECPRRQ